MLLPSNSGTRFSTTSRRYAENHRASIFSLRSRRNAEKRILSLSRSLFTEEKIGEVATHELIICAPEPPGTTDRILQKSSQNSTDFSPNRRRFRIMSRNHLSTDLTEILWNIKIPFHMIKLAYLMRIAVSDPSKMFQVLFSSTFIGI